MSQKTQQPAEIANYIFRAKTKEAHVIKALSELLNNANIKFAPFRIDQDGIHLSEADINTHVLVNFSLFKENFPGYRCTKPLNFHVNSGHFYKMLKTIKKKDTITLYVKDDDACKLGISVETPDENNKTVTYVRLKYIQPTVFSELAGYPNPTITSKQEFQKMKILHNISKTMTVTCPYPGLIKFYCDGGGEMFEREVRLGLEAQEDDLIEEEQEEYRQTFNTTHITGLTKCANQSGNVQIFVHKDLPLKIKMKAGTLGDLIVYIKSKERIALEQKIEVEKKRQNEETE